MSHSLRLGSIIAAGVLSLVAAAAADPADLDHRLEIQLSQLLEAKLSQRLEARLDAQAAELFARNEPSARADETATAESSHLATRMSCALDDSGTLACVAEPVCSSDEVQGPTVVASRPPLSSSPTAGC